MKGLMVSGDYLCVRACKIAEAVPYPHDGLCRKLPPHTLDAFSSLNAILGGTQKEIGEAIARSDADIIHVHNEPNWPVSIAKEYTDKPVILNVHDVTSARPLSPFDPDEEAAFRDADALVFVSEGQREFCRELGFDIDKPTVVLPNYVSSSAIVEKRLLPHIGGMVYEGGVDPRGAPEAWRDLSPIADEMELHLYPGNPNVDYGTIHPTVMEYHALIHRLSQHDWGFCGTPEPHPAWNHAEPNKLFEYFAAGIPVIALNNPPSRRYCDMGLGIYCNSISEVKRAAKRDPKPYAKRVREMRHRFTMGANIGPLTRLYEQLGGKR